MSIDSVKLRYIAHLVYQICIEGRRKVIIFTDWPFTQWEVEWFLMSLGYNVIGIRSAHKMKDCESALDAFKNQDNPVDVLVTSIRLMATGVNLQYDCSDMIFADCPQSALLAIHCGGRILRMGQRRICNLYVLTVDHSYDKFMQANRCNKMLGIIAGQGKMKVTKDDIAKYNETGIVT